MFGSVSGDFMSFVIARDWQCPSWGGGCDNSLKVQYYLSYGRNYYIYFVFIPTLTHKYESLQVFYKIYSLRIFFSCR